MPYIITPYAAGELLKNSEKHGGHPCTRHLSISNEGLMQRLREAGRASARDGYITYISAFLTLADAGRALSEVLRKTEKGAVKRIATGGAERAEFIDLRTDTPYRARFAAGGAGVTTLNNLDRVSLVLEHKPNFEGHNFIVLTFFPRPPDEWRV